MVPMPWLLASGDLLSSMLTCWKNDNGRAVLSNKLWNGIPNAAVVHLTLLRGNVEIVEIDEEIVKVYGETHAELPIILIKDMDSIQLEQ